jgi:hypothetical protein
MWVFIKHCDAATNSRNGLANTGDVAEVLTAIDLQEPPVSDLLGKRPQMVLTLKMFLV